MATMYAMVLGLVAALAAGTVYDYTKNADHAVCAAILAPVVFLGLFYLTGKVLAARKEKNLFPYP